MKKNLPPDTELKQIDDSLKIYERILTILALISGTLMLVAAIAFLNDIRELESIKKQSPKRELKADHNTNV